MSTVTRDKVPDAIAEVQIVREIRIVPWACGNLWHSGRTKGSAAADCNLTARQVCFVLHGPVAECVERMARPACK